MTLRSEIGHRITEDPPAPPAVRPPIAILPSPTAAPPRGIGATPIPTPAPAPLSVRLHKSLGRAAASGDPADDRRATRVLAEAIEKGPAGLAALRAAWDASPDARVRLRLLPSILFLARGHSRSFLVEESSRVASAELRLELLAAAVRYATPGHANSLKPVFLAVLDAGHPVEEQKRAIEGLRYAGGTDVEEALLRAAGAPEPDLRQAALLSLASRPALGERFISVLANEPSAAARALAECQHWASTENHP